MVNNVNMDKESSFISVGDYLFSLSSKSLPETNKAKAKFADM
jgi:hypothetical protein